jgi:hypothetical protein
VTAVHPEASRQAVVEAALVLLERMGLTPADLLAAPAARPAAPTFAEYIPVVSAAVSTGTRRAYGSYWNRVTDQWGSRRLDEPTPSDRAGMAAPACRGRYLRRRLPCSPAAGACRADSSAAIPGSTGAPRRSPRVSSWRGRRIR